MNDDCLKTERELREQWQTSHMETHAQLSDQLVRTRQELDRRLDEMNEFRKQISEERHNFITRESYDREHNRVTDDINVLKNQHSNWSGRITMFWILWGGVIVAINWILHK